MSFKFKPTIFFKEVSSNIYRISSVSEKIDGYVYDDIVTSEIVIKAMKDENLAVTIEDHREELVWEEQNW